MTLFLISGFIVAFGLLAVQITVATKVIWISSYYLWVFWFNIVIIGTLAVATLMRIWQLLSEVRRKKYGSKLALKLFTVLALASIVPSLVVYGISYRFLDSTIDSWFKLEIDQTVSGGINLARWVTNEEAKKLARSANTLSLILSDENPEGRKDKIASWREVLAVESITLFDEDRNIINHSHKDLISLSANLPDALTLKDVGFRAVTHVVGLSKSDGDKAKKNLQKNINAQEIRVLVRIPISQIAVKQAPVINLAPTLSTSNFNNGIDTSITTDFTPTFESLGKAIPKVVYMQILQPVPQRISEGLENLSEAYKRYGELQQGRDGLKKLFLTSLSLLFALALISALALAFYFSNRFIRPLGILTEGTRAVARGDFSGKLFESGRGQDEFDQLITSFNDMTDELKSAQFSAEQSRKAMGLSEKFLQNVLDNITAGVVIVDVNVLSANSPSLKISMINNSGARLIGKGFEEEFVKPLNKWKSLRVFAQTISEQILKTSSKNSKVMATSTSALDNKAEDDFENEWATQIDLRLAHGFRSFMLRGVRIPNDKRWVVVFDDITDLLRNKHMQVWSEMARRLAHEIKNPLTPIQLSAERLLVKLGDKIPEEQIEFFERSIGTIVSQVDAIKTLVNQFREMARPASTLSEVFSINDLLAEVAALYDDKRVKINKPRKKYWINADRHQLRQVFHNLILNAEQANFEKIADWDSSRVLISMQELVSRDDLTLFDTNQSNINVNDTSAVNIEVCDIGGGFNTDIINRAFEPNVTSKIKGSGLGLSIVRKIIEEHRGSIKIDNCKWIAGDEGFEWDDISQKDTTVNGAVISIMLPTVEKK